MEQLNQQKGAFEAVEAGAPAPEEHEALLAIETEQAQDETALMQRISAAGVTTLGQVATVVSLQPAEEAPDHHTGK